MNTALSILNLSAPDPHRLAPDGRFDDSARTIGSPGDVSGGTAALDSPGQTPPGTTEQFLILYVVGHGVQHGLIDSQERILDEVDVAREIQTLRKGRPTLVIWDVCFAKSMLQVGKPSKGGPPGGMHLEAPLPKDANSWPKNFIHIFSCRAFERTWHNGRETSPARTVFSTVLCEVVAELERRDRNFTWEQLEKKLRAQFRVQQPSIVKQDVKWLPRDFELSKWLGIAAQTTGKASAVDRAQV